MDKLKFAVFSIVVLALVGILGYWAVFTIQSGSEHSRTEKIKQLEADNNDLRKEVESLTSELGTLQARLDGIAANEQAELAEAIQNPEPVTPGTHKHQTLIDELQKLVDDDIFMKEKSRGTRVGTVQKFLNLYNNTTKRIDNDYGPGTVTAVKAFQKDQGLVADGEAGPNTFRKMIDWLKKQG